MCGLVGLYDAAHRLGEQDLFTITSRMAETLRHRGPDSGSTWIDAEASMALGHRRLAIVDLSEEGNQPMASAGGQFVIIFNGEFYNFRSLRQELAGLGHRFRGRSDTEVFLTAVEQWGLDRALARTVGMFAFALWDRRSRTLHLVRDRLGKKPLYFGWVGQCFLFASELKAFHAHPAFVPEVDRNVLAAFLRHSCVPSPYSIYKDIFKLPPSSQLTLQLNGGKAPRGRELLEAVQPYWSALAAAQRGAATPLEIAEHGAIEQLDELLTQAVADRLITDVPLGALLSGGIDSSTVVALMQKQSSRPVKTFSIGFYEFGFDEAPSAKQVASHLGTDHTEFYVTSQDAQAVIPRLPEIYDEPFADASQIPTFLVSQLARRHVTVVLSGDGGDETFGGYAEYLRAREMTFLFWLPPGFRSLAAHLLTTLSPESWDRLFGAAAPILPGKLQRALAGDRIHKLAGVLPADSLEALYRTIASHWAEPAKAVCGAVELPTAPMQWPDKNFIHAMMALDTVTYLPDDILTKVDRASMAVSLEVRAPLLDHRVVEFAWRLPVSMKVRGKRGKHILLRVLDRYVPRELVERPKQGFGIPLADWLRGPLREWAEALLEEKRLQEEGFFSPQPIRHKWAEHLGGRRNWSRHLWVILMFQAWLDRWRVLPLERPTS